MKIIRHAIEVANWRLKIICYNCGTEMEASVGDVTYSGEAGDWHDSGWENYSVNCPECNRELNIAPQDIHNLVKAKIQNKRKWFWQ